MKVLLATGVSQLDEAIQQRIKKVDFVGSALYKEMVIDLAEVRHPDVIVLSELLEGVMPTRELVLKIVTRFTDMRIIYIMKENKVDEKRFLYKWHVFDILPSKFGIDQFEDALFNPKKFSNVKDEIRKLEKLETEDDFLEPEPDLTGLNNIKGEEYNRLRQPKSGTNNIVQQVVAFWSVRDHAGKTFSAVNTSLMLATAKDLKILLIDFNLENPGVHLQLKFFDENKNLGAFIQDLSSGKKITKTNFEDYLTTHPIYPNLKVFPGNFLKMKNKDAAFNTKVFEFILKIAEQIGYSSVLIDMNSGIRDELSISILKKSTRILLFVSEDPGSLNAARRCLDPSVGPFAENLIDVSKVVPVITKSQEANRITFLKMLEKTLKLRAGAYVEDSPLALQSVFSGEPILSKKPSGEMYNSFVMISNLIHKDLFARPIKTVAPKAIAEEPVEKKSKGFFGKKNEKKEKISVSKTKGSRSSQEVTGNYAGAFTRFMAMIVDGLILGTISSTTFLALGINPGNPAAIMKALPIYSVLNLMLMFYFPLMESSKWQGTVGKKVLGLVVVDENDQRISFGKAFLRTIAKYFISGGVTICIGYLIALFHKRKQSLHDLIAKTYVKKK